MGNRRRFQFDRRTSFLRIIGLLVLIVPLMLAAKQINAATTVTSLRTWSGKSAMISNNGVYRSHEYIYNDYVYDDHGANTDGIDHTDAPFGVTDNPGDPTNPIIGSSGGQIRYAGDYMYPATSSGNGNFHYDNVADLIEFRVAQDANNVYYRVLLGDLQVADSTVVGICVDEDHNLSTSINDWPYGAGVHEQLGCDHIYTLFGTGAYVTRHDGQSFDLKSLGGAVAVDVAAHTLEMRVPLSVANPNGATWRYFVGSGLWDAANNQWLQLAPGPQVLGAPTATGGGTIDPLNPKPQLFDVLANNNEPNTYWREERQANDLFAQYLVNDYTDINFTHLAQDGDDPDPKLTGTVDRIYLSQHPMNPPDGIEITNIPTHNFVYDGRYQPYAMIVPATYWDQLASNPSTRLAMDYCLHPLNGNHHTEIYYAQAQARRGYSPIYTGTLPSTGYLGFEVYEGLYNRLNKLYACVNGRGEGVGYTGGDGLVDYLEVKQDVERHYQTDPDQTTLHGISLGAIGTWYTAQLYPDKYSAVMPYIFSPFSLSTNLENLYNLPAEYTIGTFDEFGQFSFGDTLANQLETLNSEYLYIHFLKRFHELSLGDEVQPFTQRLFYPRKLVVDPARVRYTFDPSKFSPKIPGAGAAYWVSGMTPRATGGAGIDVTSLGRADELPHDQVVFTGVYSNTTTGELVRFRGLFRETVDQFNATFKPQDIQEGYEPVTPFVITHTALLVPPVSNGFTITTTNLAKATMDTGRMKVDPQTTVVSKVSGDGSLDLTLLGAFPANSVVTLDGAVLPATITATALKVTLPLNGKQQRLVIGPPGQQNPTPTPTGTAVTTTPTGTPPTETTTAQPTTTTKPSPTAAPAQNRLFFPIVTRQ